MTANSPVFRKLTATLTLGISISLSIFLTPAIADSAKPAPSFKAIEINDKLSMLTGVDGFVGGNVAVLYGDDGVVLVDNGLADKLNELNSALSTVTDAKINYVLNTHVHGDHTGNNAHFGQQGGVIIAHDKLRAGLIAESAIDYKSPAKDRSAIPTISFSDQMSLYINGESIRLIHQSNAHTNGDSLIHFSDSNVIHTGDLMFNGLFPFIDVNRGGSVDGYIAALEAIKSLADGETKIIPGHGELTGSAGLEIYIAMVKDCRNIIAKLIDQGKNIDQIVELKPLQKYAEKYSWGFISDEKMIRQVYASLSETPLTMRLGASNSVHGYHH